MYTFLRTYCIVNSTSQAIIKLFKIFHLKKVEKKVLHKQLFCFMLFVLARQRIKQEPTSSTNPRVLYLKLLHFPFSSPSFLFFFFFFTKCPKFLCSRFLTLLTPGGGRCIPPRSHFLLTSEIDIMCGEVSMYTGKNSYKKTQLKTLIIFERDAINTKKIVCYFWCVVLG